MQSAAASDHAVGNSPRARMQPLLPRARLSLSCSRSERGSHSRPASRFLENVGLAGDPCTDWEGVRVWILRPDSLSAVWQAFSVTACPRYSFISQATPRQCDLHNSCHLALVPDAASLVGLFALFFALGDLRQHGGR